MGFRAIFFGSDSCVKTIIITIALTHPHIMFILSNVCSWKELQKFQPSIDTEAAGHVGSDDNAKTGYQSQCRVRQPVKGMSF